MSVSEEHKLNLEVCVDDIGVSVTQDIYSKTIIVESLSIEELSFHCTKCSPIPASKTIKVTVVTCSR
jgi:hypothetical protein